MRNNKKKLIFTAHALIRFRERWTECGHMERTTICTLIEKQIREAASTDDTATLENGVYYPITVMGKDGYAVVNGERVITILPEEWCLDVIEVIKAKRNRTFSGVTHENSNEPREDDRHGSSSSDG